METIETGIGARRFTSWRDAWARLNNARRGPSVFRAMRSIPPRLREMVMLCVSMTNDCAA